MRQIKFRAYSTVSKTMYDPSNLDSDSFLNVLTGKLVSPFVHFPDGVEMEEEVDLIPMQFTGLLDKNGKEIYEGDRIKFNLPKDNYWASEKDRSPIGSIRYESDHGGYIVEFRESGIRQNYLRLNCDIAFECEVVGNIHEHPSLLSNQAKG